MANCRSCNAEINWVITSKGKNMPVDAEPVNIAMPDNKIIVAYNSHFATCPNAQEHRQKSAPPKADNDLPL